MNLPRLLSGLMALLLVFSPELLAQAGTGNKYRVTTKMEMPGMGMSMPGQTMEVCGAKNEPSQSMVPADKNCTVRDYRVTGNKTSFRMVCTGRDALEGTGEFEMVANGYRGKMDMMAEGERMVMRFEGTRIGDCNYATESPQAQGQAMAAKQCKQTLSEPGASAWLLSSMFIGPNAVCAADKPRFCAKVTPLADNLRDLREAEAIDALGRKSGQPGYLWQGLEGCGLQRKTVLAKACDRAESTQDMQFFGEMCPDRLPQACSRADALKLPEFVAGFCPTQAQALAGAHCVSRGFTADSASPYGAFCNAFAKQRLRSGRGAPDSEATEQDESSQPVETEGKKPSWRDRLRDVIGN